MRHALIDVGSNTIRMNVYDINKEEGTFTHLFSEKEMLGIINFIEDGLLVEEGIEKLLSILSSFKRCSDSVSSDCFTCFATASLRGLLNKDAVMQKIKESLGVDVDLISGENEALYDFYGIKKYFNIEDEKGLLMDMGGGSTEFLSFSNGEPLKLISEPVASLAFHKKFVSKILPQKEEIAAMVKYADRKLEKIPWISGKFDEVFFIGGTARAIAKIHRLQKNNLAAPINGYLIKTEDLSDMLYSFCSNKREFAREIIREAPDRIHTVVPGLILYSRIMKFVKCGSVKISSFGVREGYLFKNILNQENYREI